MGKHNSLTWEIFSQEKFDYALSPVFYQVLYVTSEKVGFFKTTIYKPVSHLFPFHTAFLGLTTDNKI